MTMPHFYRDVFDRIDSDSDRDAASPQPSASIGSQPIMARVGLLYACPCHRTWGCEGTSPRPDPTTVLQNSTFAITIARRPLSLQRCERR